MDGSLFFGPLLHIDFAPIGKSIGARAKVKVGPEITGEINMGMLQDMRDYRPEAYGNAELTLCGKLAMEGYITNRHRLIWGEIDEHKIFSWDNSFGKYNLQLFPDYQKSTAVATTSATEELKTDMATYIPEPPLTDIETGFEILDSLGEVVDSVFVGTILAEPEEIAEEQTFEAEIVLPSSIKQEQLKGYTMRPIFHYAGYTISAAPTKIRKDMFLQPYTATQSNGAMTFISSGPFLGSAKQDSTFYQVGMYLPVPIKDNVYKNDDPSASVIVIGKHIDSSGAAGLVGTWEGVLNGEEITMTLLDDGTGTFNNDRNFEYLLNNPQSGDLQLVFDDGETIILRVLSISDTKLTVINKRDKSETVWILTRKR